LIGALSEELEESCREERNWSTDRLTVRGFQNGAVGDLEGTSWPGRNLVRLKSGRLFFERRLGRTVVPLDPAKDALRTWARVSEIGFNISSSVDESMNSSGMGGYGSGERDGGETRPLRGKGTRDTGEGTAECEESCIMVFSNCVDVVDDAEEDLAWRMGALWKPFS